MAWSVSDGPKDRGFIDGNDLQVSWKNTFTITQIDGASAGYIKLRITVRTSEFWTWTSWGGGYDCYTSDRLVNLFDTKDSVTIRSRYYVNNNLNPTYDVSIPASWIGKTVKAYIAGWQPDFQAPTFVIGAAPTYSITYSPDNYTTIVANRISSPVGGTGNLSNGSVIYSGDVLQINFTPITNYGVIESYVNNSSYTPGSNYTVSGNVTVTAVSQALASDVGATNADIESVSTITVTRHNTGYYHSLQYSFGGLTGYIKSDGSVSSTEVKYTQVSIAFVVPTSFYKKMPSEAEGTCTITCRTYENSTSSVILGEAKTCTFTVTVSSSSSAPTVAGTVVDTNSITVGLTGNSNKLIKYKSTAKCTISATAKNSASIESKAINGEAVSGTTRSITKVETNSFTFNAVDSRGLSTTVTVTKTMVNYIPLTINASIVRESPTSSKLLLALTGNFFNGNFGAANNTLKLQYRYHSSDASAYGSWKTISLSNVSISGNSYSTPVSIELTPYSGDSFSYQKGFQFQLSATDGTTTYPLTTVTTTVIVQKGIPVFDWGENDFQFNVPVDLPGLTINGTSLADYIRNIINS